MKNTAAITRYATALLLSIPLFIAPSLAQDTELQERKSAISSGNSYFQAFFSGQFGNEKGVAEFSKIASKIAFNNSVVVPVKNGYLLYSPSSPSLFILPKKSVRKSDQTYDRLFGLSPSYVFKTIGKPETVDGETFLKLAYNRFPDAIAELANELNQKSEDEFKLFLSAADKDMQAPEYKSELFEAVRGPYIRAAKYKKCADDLSSSAITRSIKADLLNSGMNDYINAGFQYIDFIPLSESEATLVMTSTRDALLYTMSHVKMGEPCQYGGQTMYKAF